MAGIVTLTTDFGLRDAYVAEMKGVMLGIAHTARQSLQLIDVTHEIERHDITEGALALEEMWNEFASSYSFSLLCGYSMRTFGRESHKGSVAAICDKHAHVIPTESYLEVELGSRMREIALLQQRAQALDSELSRRDEIESSLRVALSTAEARVRD